MKKNEQIKNFKESIDYKIFKNEENIQMIGHDGKLFIPEYIGVALSEIGHSFAAFCGFKETKLNVQSPMYRAAYIENSLNGFVSMVTTKEITIEFCGTKLYDPRHKRIDELDYKLGTLKSYCSKKKAFDEIMYLKYEMGLN